MSVLDIILGGFILFGIIRGFMKGLFVEIASIIALIAGIYGAIHFSNFASEFLQTRTEWNEKMINITAFVITFVVIVLAVALAGKALTKLADFAALGIINKLLGAIFGGLKIGLILSVLMIVFSRMNNTLPFMTEEDLEDSVLYHPVKAFIPMILPSILETKEALDETNQAPVENEV